MRGMRQSWGRRAVVAVAAGMVASLALPVAARLAGTGGAPPSASAAAPKAPGQPVVFEPNVGQAGAGVNFIARGLGLSLALTPTEAHFTVRAVGKDGQASPASASVRLVGAGPAATLVPSGAQRATTNYFIGNDPSKWHTDGTCDGGFDTFVAKFSP